MEKHCADPCYRCSRVATPALCDNSNCAIWRRWFTRRWDEMRHACRCQMDRAETIPLGIPLGGFHYAHPHRIREYRQQDPCKKCALTPICAEKCKIRIRWEQQGGMQ